MSDLEVLMWLAVVAALASYLYYKHRQGMRRPFEPHEPAKWNGKAIDVTPLKPKIEAVRRNYLAARQPVQGICFHRALIELARRAVAQLAFFHDREPEHPAQAHGP